MFHQTGALYALYEIVSNGNASYAFEGDGEVMLLAPEENSARDAGLAVRRWE